MAQTHGVNLSLLDAKELDEIIEAARQAKLAKQAASTIALAGILDEVIEKLQERVGDTHPKLMEIKKSWLPKPAALAKKYGLSETQRDNALDKGRKAVDAF